MPATLSAGIDSLILKIKTPMEADGVTPRDDLIGVKVWYSTQNNFDVAQNQCTLAYDGSGLDISITGLTSGTLYYVRYALISEIEPDFYTLSGQLSGTPVYETQTVDSTAPPTPTGVEISAGVGTVFIKHDVPTYTAGRGHRKTHVFAIKDTGQAAGFFIFANATLVSQFTGNISSFSSDPATKWRIWLKWETNNGVLSTTAAGGANGFAVTTSEDVSTLLTALSNKIGTGQLAAALNSRLTNLDSQYVVKVGAAGQVAGFGVASTANDSGNATSEFGVQADKFWIAPPAVIQASAPTTNLYRGMVWVNTSVTPNVTNYYTGSAWSTTRQTVLPFAVVTSPEVIGGQTVNPGVYIDAAYIKDGTITNAKIGDATITAAKIGSVDATKITVNQLTASQINSNGLSIRDAAGNLLLDATNSQLGVSLYVGTGSNKKLLSTVGAYASVPTTSYIGEFASAPTFTTSGTFNSWARANGVATVYTNEAHNLVLASQVYLSGNGNLGVGYYEIIEIVNTTTFKIVNGGPNDNGAGGSYSGYRLAQNSVYKNTANGTTYILSGNGATLAWNVFLQNGQSVKLQYSADNVNWRDAFAAGDIYVRTGTLSPGSTTYSFGASTKFVPVKGTDYYDGTSVKLQYSADNVNWRDTYAAGDIYIRSGSKASGASDFTWGAGARFVGIDGKDSTVAGPRGSTWAYISGQTSWSDTVANNYFTNNFGGVKVINDTVTQYGTNFSQTRVWNGSSWLQVAVAIDGNLLVKGTVTADAVATGTVIVGSTVKSSDDKFIIDFANKYISISV